MKYMIISLSKKVAKDNVKYMIILRNKKQMII